MSRVYFHTRTSTAKLRGSERAWLRHIAGNAARPWWGLDATDPLDRALEIVDMIVPGGEGQYVRNHAATYRAVTDNTRHPINPNHTLMIAGLAEQARTDHQNYKGMWEKYMEIGNPAGKVHYDYNAESVLVDILRTCLSVTNVPLKVAGRVLFSQNVEMNTAMAVGYDAVALAAKIHGWCEIHPWISESGREWFADLIEYSVDLGLYRDGVWYDRGSENKRWITQGWEEIRELLRDTKHHPGEVVLSTSVCGQFPNSDISTTMPPWPADVPLRWDCLTPEQKTERSEARHHWQGLTPDQQWDTGMEGLKTQRPWAHITPDNLSTSLFGPPVDLLDLFHHDRDNRVEQAFQRFEQTFNHPGQDEQGKDHDGSR